MKIRRVKFKHYRIHRNLELQFTGNLIGLTGNNGSGKSRLITGIRDCLTGDFEPTKEKCVTWGEKEGELEVEVELTPSRSMIVNRQIPSGKAWLRFSDMAPGEKSIVGPAKVNELILETLGTDKSILTNIVFVAQRSIETLLFSKGDTLKGRLAQRFFGLDKAQILEKALGTVEAKIQFDSLEQQIPALTAEIAGIKKQLDQHYAAWDALVPEVVPEQIRHLEEQHREAADFTNREAGLRALSIAAAGLQAQIEAAAGQIEIDAAQLSRINVDQLDALYQRDLQVQQAQVQFRNLESAIARCEQGIAAAGPAPVSPEDLKASQDYCAQVSSATAIKRSRAEDLHREVVQMVGTPVCPKCGQPVDLSHRAKMQQELVLAKSELELMERDLFEAANQRDNLSGMMDAWSKKIGNSPHQLGFLRGQLTELGPVSMDPVDPQKYLAARRQVDAMNAALVEQQKTVAAAQKNLTDNLQEQERVRQSMMSGQSPGDPLAIARELEILRHRQAMQAEVRSNIKHAQAALHRAQAQFNLAREAATENQVMAEYQRAISRLREVFHPEGAPKVLVSRTVEKLEAGVNRYLEMLDLEFRAKAKDGLDFDYIFPHGLGDPDDLSVGQQVDMAWAFRLSAMNTLGASVGFMSMDEPTAPLDKKTKQHFHLLLDHLRQMASAGHAQFIVATHDEDLVAFCDQHIQL